MRRALLRTVMVLIMVAVVGLPNGVVVLQDGSEADGRERSSVGYVGEQELVGEGERGHDWLIETVDSVGEVKVLSNRDTSLTIDSLGRPHISYIKRVTDGPYRGYVKYAHNKSEIWINETLDSIGFIGRHTSIALDKKDNPHICYYSYEQMLKYGHHDGLDWNVEIVTSSGDVGWYNSISIDSNNLPHIGCYDYTYDDLIYSYRTDDQWQSMTVVSEGKVGYATSIVLDSSNLPHISYVDLDNNRLQYAHFNGSQWLIHDIDWVGGDSYDTSIDIGSDDLPHIGYVNNMNGELKHAHFNGGKWKITIVDSQDYVGRGCSLSLDSHDRPHIAYLDVSNGNLKYSHFDGETWQTEIIDFAGDVGYSASIAMENNNIPHISYLDNSKSVLKHAMLLEREPPQSTVNPLLSYWQRNQPLPLTVSATDNISGVRDVELWYRYSDDNSTWYDWILFEKTETSPYLFDFTFPEGNGYYELYSVATDAHGNTEIYPETDIVRCGYDTEKPTANGGVDSVITIGDTLSFDGSESRDNLGIMKYTWYFDGEETWTMYGVNPNYTFDNVGIFEITLEVVDWAGFRDIDTVLVTVYDDIPPVAEAGDNVEIMEGNKFILDGSSSMDNVCIVDYVWLFMYDGEEKNLSGELVEFAFLKPGVYEIILTVMDEAGNTASDGFNLSVIDITSPEPKAALNGTVVEEGGLYRTEINRTVFFNASSSIDNMGIVNYTWEIDGSRGIEELEGEKAVHVFTRPGTYTIILRIKDAEGNTGELDFKVEVLEVVIGDDDNDDDVTPGDDDGNRTVEGQGGSGVIVWVVVIAVVIVAIVGAIIVIVVVQKKGGKKK